MVDNPHASDSTVELISYNEVTVKLVIYDIIDVDVSHVNTVYEYQDVCHCLLDLAVTHTNVMPEWLLSEVELDIIAQAVHINSDEVVCSSNANHVSPIVWIRWVTACKLAKYGHQ